jgi:hypothetical protein
MYQNIGKKDVVDKVRVLGVTQLNFILLVFRNKICDNGFKSKESPAFRLLS